MSDIAERPRKTRVWVGITETGDPVTWSTARDRPLCRAYLEEVYSEDELRREISIVRATLALDTDP